MSGEAEKRCRSQAMPNGAQIQDIKTPKSSNGVANPAAMDVGLGAARHYRGQQNILSLLPLTNTWAIMSIYIL